MTKDQKLINKVDITGAYPLIFTVIFVVVLFQYSFAPIEAFFYDLRIRFDLGTSYKENVVLITLDEESDEFLGESYPYTFISHEKMLDRLIKDRPKIINYMVNLLEPETNREEADLLEFKKKVEDYEKIGGKFRFGSIIDKWGVQRPPRQLQSIGSSMAIINIDSGVFAKDDVSRRAIINISGEDTLHLWTANEYRSSQGREKLEIKDIQGAYYVNEADATFSMFRYSTTPVQTNGRIKTIPFHRVRVGNFPKGFFQDKIVLVGSSYISNASDFVLTPFNKEKYNTSVLSLHAQIIQSLIENKTVYQVSKNLSYILCIVISVLLSLTISRLNPSSGLMITLVIMFSILILSFLMFWIFGYWVYISHIIMSIFVVYYIWVPFRAIDEYQRRYAIQEETKLLKKVENLKQNFISLMSHDLKTPVAKIAGMADVMKHQHQGDMELERGLQSIIDSTKELNRFITSILDLTKVESRNLQLNMVNKDINNVIEATVKDLKYEANQKNIEVQMDLGPLYPIEFDINLMKRVISNLIENAIKYSSEGTHVSIKSWDDDEWVYVEIQDNGPGIPEHDVQHIFEKFYRVKNDATHEIKGSGLGLYLVKYFVELHGGTIQVISELGNGTTFLIKLKNQ